MPVRVLQIVHQMNRGGVETWLMHVLRNINRERYKIDFLVHTDQPCVYDEEIRSLGANIFQCHHPSKLLSYTRDFNRLLSVQEPYDIIHSHVHFFSGYNLRLAYKAGVPIRIAHSHTCSVLADPPGWRRRVYLSLMRRLLIKYATVGLSASKDSGSELFGHNPSLSSRSKVLHCAIDLTSYRTVIDSYQLRLQLGIPVDAYVVGHVGRFAKVKNHAFILDIAGHLCKRENDIYFLLVGDGQERHEIVREAIRRGLDDRIVFAGIRSDVPDLMIGAMDAFILPSCREGLALVTVEAQAAGLPCIVSEALTDEADIVTPLITRLLLSQGADAWADEILSLKNQGLPLTKLESLEIVENSSFNIVFGIKELEQVYNGQ